MRPSSGINLPQSVMYNCQKAISKHIYEQRINKKEAGNYNISFGLLFCKIKVELPTTIRRKCIGTDKKMR